MLELEASLQDLRILTWKRYDKYLSAEIRDVESLESNDPATAYHHRWVCALEKMLCNVKFYPPTAYKLGILTRSKQRVVRLMASPPY